MKLPEGTYENIITNEIQTNIDDTQAEGLVCKEEEIDNAESPSMFAEHISRIIKNKLSDESISSEERADFINRVIDCIGDNEQEKIYQHEKILSAVVSQSTEAQLQATNKQLVKPLTGFRTSSLFTGSQSSISLNTEIERDIQSADNIYIIVSFLKLSGVNLIYNQLKEFCKKPNHQLRIITTTYCGVTDPKAVERLSELPNTEIKISYNTRIERLHAKSYIFERNSGFSTAYIGSSNLSKSAQTDGLEWNIRVTNIENSHIIKTALATFNMYWNSPNFEDYKIGGKEKLYRELAKEQPTTKIDLDKLCKYTVLPHQKQILDKLTLIRKNGIYKNLIVAATGTGKTVISAFDYKLFRQNNPNNDKILFIAHRKEILKQAHYTYKSILQDPNFGDLWVGEYKPSSLEHLFVSVNTFHSQYEQTFSKLGADYYDYIVIDEAHHITADSYRNILIHFRPKILIGLTATPERMDGVSLLPDFDNQISAEIRLPLALNEGLLTPFQYLCISDDTDLTNDNLMQGGKYIASKITEILCNTERVGLIINKLSYYLPDEYKCKALCFCATKEHAYFMAERFKAYGMNADYLTSDNEEKRDELRKKLASGEINYLFVVDMFNEGIDIPEIDTVLFLRPTESLTIFLQQLGRGLRLAPGKNLLTVFDFVAQLNKKYDYASRFRSLLVKNDKGVVDQIKNGFTLLPHGCSIHMEEKTQRYVLENIKSAIYNKSRLITELKTYNSTPTLSEFIENNGQDIRHIYKDKYSWTKLKLEAGKCSYTTDENTRYFDNNIKNLIHSNSIEYLKFVNNLIHNLSDIQLHDDREKSFATIFYYTLYGKKINDIGFKTIEDAFQNLSKYPLYISEIEEIIEYKSKHIEQSTFYIGQGLPTALEQYGCYTREEIFAIFGRQTIEKKMQGSVSGIFKIDELNTELFFVTLNKSDKDFSPSTMYDDYVISENKFHMKSQNTDSHSGSGKRFVEQAQNHKKFILFVREDKKDGFGNTCPFYCFGLVDYISSRDDRPMSIDWKVQQPILPQFIKAV